MISQLIIVLKDTIIFIDFYVLFIFIFFILKPIHDNNILSEAKLTQIVSYLR